MHDTKIWVTGNTNFISHKPQETDKIKFKNAERVHNQQQKKLQQTLTTK